MPDAQKKHRLTLKGHSEEVTDSELSAVKDMTGDRFSEYTVEAIQPAQPADVVPTRPPRPGAPATPNADAPAA